MPLPWLIGAAVVAAATAVVKAVNNNDSSSSYDSGDAERRRQEREACLQRKRDGLAAKVKNLNKDCLIEAHELLARSAEVLVPLQRKTAVLSISKLENAFMGKRQADSTYALGLYEILRMPEYLREDFTQNERSEFLINLQILEKLYDLIPFGREEQRDLDALKEVRSRLARLQNLKQQLEQQG